MLETFHSMGEAGEKGRRMGREEVIICSSED